MPIWGYCCSKSAGRAEAIAPLRRALELTPADLRAQLLLAQAMFQTRAVDEATAEAERALRDHPGDADALLMLGVCEDAVGKVTPAEARYRQILQHQPNLSAAWSNLGNTLRSQGRIVEAIEAHRRAVAADPADASLHSNLLLTLISSELDPVEVTDEHLTFGRKLQAVPVMPRTAKRRPGRLRIGFVSGDFTGHAVSYFIRPIFEHLDGGAFETFAYASSHRVDETTRALMATAGQWRNIAALADDTAAEMIGGDDLDLLIDLSGHTAHNRLPVLARRPARTLATYLGYPGTTGLSRIDWRLTDMLADPPGTTETYYSERLMRLPAAWCYAPPPAAPLPAPSSDEPFTFGSFNALAKVNATTIALWSRVLHASPGARLLIKSSLLSDSAVRERYLAAFANEGVDAERLVFIPQTREFVEHLATYGQMDAALDTFPYTGTTTTCEAMWMGVPVVTLAGRTHASRVGASLLSRAGFGELAAATEEAFVSIASALARQGRVTNAARLERRGRMAASRLTDGVGFAREFGPACRVMCGETA